MVIIRVIRAIRLIRVHLRQSGLYWRSNLHVPAIQDHRVPDARITPKSVDVQIPTREFPYSPSVDFLMVREGRRAYSAPHLPLGPRRVYIEPDSPRRRSAPARSVDRPVAGCPTHPR